MGIQALYHSARRHSLFASGSIQSPHPCPIQGICRECAQVSACRGDLKVWRHINLGLGWAIIGISQLLPCHHYSIPNSSPVSTRPHSTTFHRWNLQTFVSQICVQNASGTFQPSTCQIHQLQAYSSMYHPPHQGYNSDSSGYQ